MAVTVFGYLIFISIEFDDFISLFSPQLQFRMKRGIKHSSQGFAKFPNASKFVQNTSRHVVISNLFRVFGNVVKQSRPCMIYYFLIKYVQYYVILSFAFLPTIVTKLSRNSTTLTSFSKLCFFLSLLEPKLATQFPQLVR